MKSIIAGGVSLLVLATVPAAAQAPTDAQIAAIVVAANQVDIDAGALAVERGTHADVKAFGRMMQTDHAGVNKAAVELVTRLKLTPEENATSRSLKEGGDRNLARLRTLSGAAFDRAYIDQEVAYHQAVLDAVDKTLIPGAQNADLKALLVKVRPAFVAHLERAKQIQATLARTVSIEGSTFHPEVVTVSTGERVVWVNRDFFPHTATEAGGAFDSGALAPDASWSFTATTRGRFAYACAFHPTMKGTVIVNGS